MTLEELKHLKHETEKLRKHVEQLIEEKQQPEQAKLEWLARELNKGKENIEHPYSIFKSDGEFVVRIIFQAMKTQNTPSHK